MASNTRTVACLALSLCLYSRMATCIPQAQGSGVPTTGSGGVAQPWQPCNYPAQGIFGLQCTPGYSCICKDESYSQCRQQGPTGWAANSCWQCQSPTDKANGFLQSTLQGNDYCAQGGSSGNVQPGSNGSPAQGGSPGNVQPGSNGSPVQGSSQPVQSPSQPVQSPSLFSSNPGGSSGMTDIKSLITQFGSSTAQVGTCAAVQAPPGWSVASTTYYNWMGTACLCGDGNQYEATWQSNTGPALGLQQGFYSGAVNNVLFRSRSSSRLTCGASCGTCYDLVTSGTNAYNDGVAGGSMITMMVVDACYGQGGANWCSGGPTSGPTPDQFGCTDHFDVQTDPTRSDVPVTGMDGTTWNHGGQIVFYRETPGGCPPQMTAAFQKDCKPNCDGRAV